MSIDAYSVLVFVHIVLFAYWLGGDLGVFLTSRRVADRTLSLDERLRFLGVLLACDMGPRTCLILFIPVGYQMAAQLGLSPITGYTLAAVWVLDLAWLALNWWMFFHERDPRVPKLRELDLKIRYVVIAVMGTMGAVSLARGTPLQAPWLAAKVLLFACLVALGVYLRIELKQWVTGFGMVRQGGAAADEGNTIIERSLARSKRAALLLWLGVALIAFIGKVKPF